MISAGLVVLLALQVDTKDLDARAQKRIEVIRSETTTDDERSAAVRELRAIAEELLTLPSTGEIDPIRIDYGVRHATTAADALPFVEADPLLRMAIAGGARVSNPDLEAWPIYDLTRRCARTGRFRALVEVLEAHPRALESDLYAGWLCLVRADGLRNVGRRREVEEWLDQAQSRCDRSAMPDDLRCQIESERALHLLDLGLPDQGFLWLEKARQRLSIPEGSPGRPTTQETWGNFARIESGFWLGIERFDRVKPPDPKVTGVDSAEFGAAWLRYGMARQRLAERATDPAERRSLLDSAFAGVEAALACKRLFDRERMRCEVTMLRIALLRGDLESAARWREIAAKHLDGLHALGERGALLEIEIRLATFALELELKKGTRGEVLEVAVAALERAFEQQLTEWSALPLRPGGVGFLHFDERRLTLDVLIEGLMALHPRPVAVEKAFALMMRTQAMSTLSRRLAVPIPTLEAAERALAGDDGALLIWLITVRRSVVFVVDPNGCDVIELPRATRGEVERIRRELETSLLLPNSPDSARNLERSARELGLVLIPDRVREQSATWRRLALSGVDLAGWLPFEVLPLRGDEPAGLTHAITYASSVPLAVALAQRAADAASARSGILSARVLAAPNVAIEGDPILELDADMQRTLTQPSPSAVTVGLRMGAEVTRDALEDLHDVGFLHLLMHGHQIYERERSAVLVFAQRPAVGAMPTVDLVGCDEIEKLRMPPLVLLSACGSMSASDRFGDDGIVHMGGAFFAAGAQCVVLARHAIDFHATVDLSGAFTAAVTHGASPAEAMRYARNAVARRDRFTHPYYWSLLQVHGVGHRSVFPQSESWDPDAYPAASATGDPVTQRRIVAVAAILLLGLLLYLRRRALTLGRK